MLRTVLPLVRANKRTALGLGNVHLDRADHKILENAAENLQVGQLDGVDPDVFGTAQQTHTSSPPHMG